MASLLDAMEEEVVDVENAGKNTPIEEVPLVLSLFMGLPGLTTILLLGIAKARAWDN